MNIATSEFRISRSRLLYTALMFRHGALFGGSVAFVVTAGFFLSIFVDWRFLLVAAMLLLIAVPGVMALLYFNYALSPRCFPEVWPHTVTFTDTGFKVEGTLPPLPAPESDAEDEVKRMLMTANGIILVLGTPPPGLLHIPYNALPEGVLAEIRKIIKCK